MGASRAIAQAIQLVPSYSYGSSASLLDRLLILLRIRK